MDKRRLLRSMRPAVMLALTGCGIFHVGRTSLEGTEVLVSAAKPAPLDSAFEGCGPAGSQPDYALNRRKNRVDEAPAYRPVPWTLVARLPWPTWAGYRFRNQWSRGETEAVAKYEGAAVEIEGYLAGYRLEIPEPPNCYSRDARHKDYHMWLSRGPDESREQSIVVELTPRVRVYHPRWTEERLDALHASQVPVRVRGWLMLDQMHPEKVERNRRTLWEVHPVMELEWRSAGGEWVSLDSIAPPAAATTAASASSAAPMVPAPPVDSVPPHDTFSVRSQSLGELRRINVWTPPGYDRSRSTRWPVLYMPDGGIDEDFPHVVNTVDSLLKRGAIRPVIVVGIPNTQRRRDLTGPTTVKTDSAIAPMVGGSAAFRAFIRDELIPAVDARYRTTGERSIVGESLAGLFVLETFFSEPSLFTHYASLDPSLWWNDGALVKSVGADLARMDAAPRTLYLATANYAPTIAAAERVAGDLRAASLPHLRWSYVPRPDLTHATIFRGVQADALWHLLQ